MPFEDRQQAGRVLAKKLEAFREAKDTIVLALPRGGVVVGWEIAYALSLPLNIVVSRKIGAPGNEECAIGAVTESGDVVWNEEERSQIDATYLEKKKQEEGQEAARRLVLYRHRFSPRDVGGKTVLIVDDGVATGLTIRAAIATVKSEGAKRIVIAVPVCPQDTLQRLVQETDGIVVLESPTVFSSVGQFYRSFPQVEDVQVIQRLHRG